MWRPPRRRSKQRSTRTTLPRRTVSNTSPKRRTLKMARASPARSRRSASRGRMGRSAPEKVTSRSPSTCRSAFRRGTVYHYRVVAVSEIEVAPSEFKAEEFDGEDQTFHTQTAGAFALPDGRAWEMVSPPDKHGANLIPLTEGKYAFQAAAAGNAMTYVATAPTESQPQGFSNVMQVLSTRGGLGGSGTRVTSGSPTRSDRRGLRLGGYLFFSSDLSLGVVDAFGVFRPRGVGGSLGKHALPAHRLPERERRRSVLRIVLSPPGHGQGGLRQRAGARHRIRRRRRR